MEEELHVIHYSLINTIAKHLISSFIHFLKVLSGFV